MEFDGKDTFFGWVVGLEKEFGSFSLSELQALRGPGGLKVERDKYFTPKPISEVMKAEGSQFWVAATQYSTTGKKYVRVLSPGQTVFHIYDTVSEESFNEENERVKKLGENPATGEILEDGKWKRIPQTSEEGWVYAKVGTTEVRGRRVPTGIDIEQVSPSFNQDDFDKAVRIIEEKLKGEKVIESLPQTSKEITYTVNLEAPKYIEEVVLEDDKAVLKRYGKPIVTFRPTDSQRRKIQEGKGRIHIFAEQIAERVRSWTAREALYWAQTTVPATQKELAVFMEMAEWFCKHRRPMTVKDLRPIATKYFGTGEEQTEFHEYLATPQGQKEFRRELRDAMRRYGIAIPPESEWLPLALDVTGEKLLPALKPFEPYKFAEYVLRSNVFTDYEIPIYSGITGMNPLRVPDQIWAEVLADIEGEFVKQGDLYVVKTPGVERPPDMRAAPTWRETIATEPELSPATIDLLAKTEGDPIRKFCCRQCGECAPAELLEEGRFPDRIAWLRSHYQEKHAGMWGKMQAAVIPTEPKELWQMTEEVTGKVAPDYPTRADLEELQRAIARWEEMLTKQPKSFEARQALSRLQKQEAEIKAQLEQELRGLRVIIANIQARQAEGWVLDEGAKKQLEAALKRQAELTGKVTPVTPEVTLLVDEVSKYETRIPLDLIRKDEKEYLAKLTEQIKKEGITEPIVIRIREDGSRILWDGIHRFIVAQDLGIKNIPIRFIGEEGIGVKKPPTKPALPTPEVGMPDNVNVSEDRVVRLPPPPSPKDELEFVSDSPEFLAYTIEDIGYRDKLDKAFETAIARAKGG